MASPVVESFTEKSAVGTSHVITAPSGIAEDDYLICLVSQHQAFAAWKVITAPAGWSELTTNTNDGAFGWLQVFTKDATASEPGTYTFTTNGANNYVFHMLRVSGVDLVDPIDIQGATRATPSTGTNIVCPDVTTTESNTLILRVSQATSATSAQDSGFPASHTGLSVRSHSDTQGVAHKDQATAGATGTATFTHMTVDTNVWGLTLVLNEAIPTIFVVANDFSATFGTLVLAEQIPVTANDFSPSYGTFTGIARMNVNANDFSPTFGVETIVLLSDIGVGFFQPANTPKDDPNSGGGFYNT